MTAISTGVGNAKISALIPTAAQSAASVANPSAPLPAFMQQSARPSNWVPQAMMNVYDAINKLETGFRL
jgi:hypothetical protein